MGVVTRRVYELTLASGFAPTPGMMVTFVCNRCGRIKNSTFARCESDFADWQIGQHAVGNDHCPGCK